MNEFGINTQEGNFTILATGDLMLGDHPLYMGVGIGSLLQRDQTPLVSAQNILNGADLVVTNLETPISDRTNKRGRLGKCLRADPRIAALLIDGPRWVVSVANNHATEHGTQAFHDSVAFLKAKGAVVVGTLECPAQLVPMGSRQLGVLAASLRPEQNDSGQGCYYLASEDELVARARALSECSDFTIVCLHWGDEYMTIPSTEQVELARRLGECGVDCIIGSHPHVVQPVSLENGTIVAYSLGNFISDMCQSSAKKGLLLRLRVGEQGSLQAHTCAIKIEENYSPTLAGDWIPVQPSSDAWGSLSPREYSRKIQETVSMFRKEYEAYFIRNWWRFPPGDLFQITFSAVVRRLFRNLAHKGTS